MSISKTAVFLSLIFSFALLLFYFPRSVSARMSEEERSFLLMYFKEDELEIVSTTRSLKSITRVAENVEVVTKEDIELMNAHTLADVLNTVNGVVVQFLGASPGSIATASIQGSRPEHVILFIDGIAMNLISSDQADLASIPVQMIEKIEVIKGPASSAWGSSLGGIINVITKEPNRKEIGGMVSASYGDRSTGDFRAELSGKKSDFGYYLYAGRLQTDGLRPVEDAHFNNIYTKFTYDVSDRTKVAATVFYNKGSRDEGDFSAIDLALKNRLENLFATASVSSTLSDALSLNLSIRAARQVANFDQTTLSTGDEMTTPLDDRKFGASGRLTWKTGIHTVVIGTDYDYKKEISPIYISDIPSMNVIAVYANDTIAINRFSITPGIRYDHTDRHNDFTSPSLGMTYEICDKTLLRAEIARGFHLPNLGALTADNLGFVHNPNLKPEEVWSYQAGIESGALKYIWVKASAFLHDVRDSIIIVSADPGDPLGAYTEVNADKVRREGFEVEMRTAKFYNLTAAAGFTYVKSRNLTTDQDIHELPDYTYDLSLKYDDNKSFRALLKGRYIWFDQPAEQNAKYNGFIFDLNLIKTLIKKEDRSLEIFATGHNLFDGSQYWVDQYKNARRWAEAGIRYKF